jgi:DUF1680 family protein
VEIRELIKPRPNVKTLRLPLMFSALVVATVSLFASDYPVQPVPFTAVRVTGGFWQERQEVNRTVTVPFALKQCEDSKRLTNFDLAAETMRRRAAGEATFQNTPATIYQFDDSDAYKVIEGAAYVLSIAPDAALEKHLDEWIARITAAQEPDGYLYTWRTMHPDSPAHKWIGRQRWEKDPESSHELYCAGHLYEAGVAHFQATGKRTLLDVCLKNAELLWRDFGDGRLRTAPGHEIVEVGLVKLYRVTGDARWLKLAQIFLDARGPGGPEYNQRHKLVVDQTEAVGHAVRANYLYSGMADVAALTGDTRYFNAITKIWESATTRKMYLTGSVGAMAKGEAYGADYELPLDGYNETCAAVALMQWAHRMFLLTGDASYMDVFERTAFNGFLSGVSVSGDRFFYTNPVAYDGQKKNNSGFAGRVPWFGCACCPPNLMRTLASLTGYFYAVRDDALFVNFYAQSEGAATIAGTKVTLAQTTGYPWDGGVRLAVSPERPAKFTLRVRIPGWAQNHPVPSDLYAYADNLAPAWSAKIAGQAVSAPLDRGYLAITREWHAGDVVELNFDLPVRTVRANDRVAATAGREAFERGPVVYCLEDPEWKMPAEAFAISRGAKLEPQPRPDLFGGVTALKLGDTTAIPYFAWENRGLATMSVWLRRTP